jgi:hypothetical protein
VRASTPFYLFFGYIFIFFCHGCLPYATHQHFRAGLGISHLAVGLLPQAIAFFRLVNSNNSILLFISFAFNH